MSEKLKGMREMGCISIAIIAVLIFVMATFPVAIAQAPFFPVVVSCNSAGDEVNQFAPGEGEDVYVKGEGFRWNRDYKIGIQDDPVYSGEPLVSDEDPSDSQELITTDRDGKFGPTLIWSMPSDAPITHHEYDIVV